MAELVVLTGGSANTEYYNGATGTDTINVSGRPSTGNTFYDSVTGDEYTLLGNTGRDSDVTITYTDGTSVTINEAVEFSSTMLNHTQANDDGALPYLLLDYYDESDTNYPNTEALLAALDAKPVASISVSGGSAYDITFWNYDEWGITEFEFGESICFGRGTEIMTDSGVKLVEDLNVGDLVETFDNGLQEIRWIGSSKVNSAGLRMKPKLFPIRIGKGSLGSSLPEKELIVSPQHRVLISSKIAKRIFDTAEVLVAANKLVGIDGIKIMNEVTEVEYFHILFDQHELVFANGIVVESLLPGKQALKAVGQEAREEIIELFPEFKDGIVDPKPARFIANDGKLIKRLVARHIQNEQNLLK